MQILVRKTFYYVVLLYLCSCLAVVCAETLQTELSRDKAALGESITLSYMLHDSSVETKPDFSPLEKDFKILSTNYGNAIRILNGVTQIQKFWQLKLEPKSSGELIIPEINFGTVKSAMRKLIVTSTPNEPANNLSKDNYFVLAEVDNKNPYVQSEVHYTFKLFYQSQLENATIEIPQTKDAVLVQVGRDRYYQTSIQGKPYFVYEKQLVLFPQKTGQLNISPTVFHGVSYDFPTNAMYDPFATIATPKKINLKSKPFSLNVKQIPPQVSANTWLPAKNLTLTEKWSTDTKEWESGNPVTRIITLEAEGLRADQLPDLNIGQIPGVNVYADPAKRSNNVRGESVTGMLQQKITYVPTNVQSIVLPSIELPWWNTKTDSQAVAQLKSVNILIKTLPNSSTYDAKQNVSLNSLANPVDLSKIDVNPPISKPPVYDSIWFWLTLLLLVTWLLTLIIFFIWKKNSRKEITDDVFNSPKKQTSLKNIEVSEKHFIQACEQGNPLIAQRFLLAWGAKLHSHNPPKNLSKLREYTQNENFQQALKDLEIALYANKITTWKGWDLLAAFRQEQKLAKKTQSTYSSKQQTTRNENDPLPPLNPNYE